MGSTPPCPPRECRPRNLPPAIACQDGVKAGRGAASRASQGLQVLCERQEAASPSALSKHGPKEPFPEPRN